MKRLSWIVSLPLLFLAVLFALSNRQAVTLDLWPFEVGLTLPLYLLFLATLFIGFLFGGLAAWLSAGRQRRRARELRNRLAALEREVAIGARDISPPANRNAPAQPQRPAANLPAAPNGR